jgi:signal peptidase II
VLLVVAALAALALDVATKAWVVSWPRGREIELLGGVVVLRESRNTGAAFGLAQGATVILSVVALGVVVVIVRTAARLRSRRWALSLGLILGGALGNLADRLLRDPAPLRGAVVDFIDLPRWPSFNVADSAIVVGGILAVLLSMMGVEPTGGGSVPDADAGDTES